MLIELTEQEEKELTQEVNDERNREYMQEDESLDDGE